ncbi:type II CRISPR RNA-guided endonuclease Cas9 [Soonwooa purpurea]
MAKIGLDIGSSSAGWFIDKDKKGVVTFNTGMTKGTSGYTSPTKDRRKDRSKRNLIKARKYRKWELLKVLAENYAPLAKNEILNWSSYQKGKERKFPESKKFLQWLACDFTYENGEKYKNPYELRVKALDGKLTNHEFGRVLYHLVQRRGYKDIGETDKETEKQLERRTEDGFKASLENNRSIAEALLNDFLYKGRRARNQYPLREEYENEFNLICSKQGYSIEKIKKEVYKDDFVNKLWKAIIWQRPLKSQKGSIGKCTLEPSKLRCPISHPAFEIFRALQFINTIKYFDENNEKQSINEELKSLLFNNLFLKAEGNFKFQEVKDLLDKKTEKPYKYNYPINPENGKYETSISGMPVCKGLISLFGDFAKTAIGEIEQYNITTAPKVIKGYSIYDLWHIVFGSDEQYLATFAIEKLQLENVKRKRKDEHYEISPLVELKRKFLQGYADLSIKAINKVIPFLKEGFLYNEAVVLAKIPELLKTDWEASRNTILDCLSDTNKEYKRKQLIATIANNLVDKHKGQTRAMIDGNEDSTFAYKDSSYLLKDDDVNSINEACIAHFGEKTWEKFDDKDNLIRNVGLEYQEYFFDSKRAYRKVPTITEIFKTFLSDKGINLNGELYHHSNRENLYNRNLVTNFKTGEKFLPKDKNTNIEILPIPLIDSIKNAMFNKSMSVVRKLLNKLIINGDIDQDTEVVIELARELNDNNKRIAIEKYQKERADNREKIRRFLQQYKSEENQSLNVEDNIAIFELWSEQIFEETEDENKNIVKNENRIRILKEKEDVKRYELWMEQKGQCMYTGKMISIAQLFSNEIDVEHTIPRSILPDNTMANQTVAFAKYNRDIKEARTPYYSENYSKDTPNGTSISPRLGIWRKLRNYYEIQYNSRKKAKGPEDEAAKNKRIQDKHYYKMHFEYWDDKLSRFEAEEIKDSWARRQLVDTQMVSKYAREYLKLYFKKVAVQKGSVTADFRKIFGFQEQDEIKSRNKHTHHIVDAAVLTMIPTNSSYREEILKEYYSSVENNDKRKLAEVRRKLIPYGFNSQDLIKEIENTTLVVNYRKDKILQQTSKVIRHRGKVQFVKNRDGEYVKDELGNKIVKIAKGDTIRSSLFAQTYIGKIKDVERDKNNKAKRENGDWKYKTGKDEFLFVVRKPIADVLSKIEDIVDPVIKELVRAQKNNQVIKDYQGNIIRHVRIKTKSGREVKERLNYQSKYEYKNKFYSEAGSVPYAILVQKIVGDKLEKDLILVPSFEIAKEYKTNHKFDVQNYLRRYDATNKLNYSKWDKAQLLNVGQRVIVLNNDEDFEERKNIEFQKNRLYKITQLADGSIYLKYHLEATEDGDIDKNVKLEKDQIVFEYDKKYNLPDIIEDESINNVVDRKKKFEKDKFSFVGLNDNRLKRLIPFMGIEGVKKLKKELDQFKKQSSFIEVEGSTPLLKMSKENWNYLFEGEDFNMSIDGQITWKNYNP